MKVTIDATAEEIDDEARRVANIFWSYNFDERDALSMFRSLNEEVAVQDGFTSAFKDEWKRLWSE